MRRLKAILGTLGLSCLLGCSSSKVPDPKPAASELFTVGDVWSYKTRPDEKSSRLIIGRVDKVDSVGVVVHIKLTGLRIKNEGAPGGFSTVMGHIPVTEAILKQSVIEKTGSNGDLEGFEEGYGTWLKAHRRGEAGYFTIPISEVVDCMEKAINQ